MAGIELIEFHYPYEKELKDLSCYEEAVWYRGVETRLATTIDGNWYGSYKSTSYQDFVRQINEILLLNINQGGTR